MPPNLRQRSCKEGLLIVKYDVIWHEKSGEDGKPQWNVQSFRHDIHWSEDGWLAWIAKHFVFSPVYSQVPIIHTYPAISYTVGTFFDIC